MVFVIPEMPSKTFVMLGFKKNFLITLMFRLRGSAPGQLLKVEAVAGDITHDRLGLSDQDQK